MRDLRRTAALTAAALLAVTLAGAALPSSASAQSFTNLGSDAPLVPVRVMVKAGSAHDPEGKEGLAFLTAALVLEGGYGDPSDPVTKEELARRTSPWGGGALPGMRVDKETTTFSMRVPREVMGTYTREILGPMLSRPLFDEGELERVRGEVLAYVETSLRNENLENLGLEALDGYIHEGTGRAHLVQGSVRGLKNITREDIQRFYATWYDPVNTIIGVGSSDEEVHDLVRSAVRSMQGLEGVRPMTRSRPGEPRLTQGREMTIVAQPNAPGAVINIGFPIPLLRSDEDFWPLWVANVWFGTHRDSFSHLYQEIRQERGYNYGDYSYIEHFANRPAYLFPPFNTPRTAQYFSIWIRPVDPAYVHHLTRAAIFELEDLVRRGLTGEQVEAAKNKARILYLNYAETASRLLEAKVDDVFYGMHEEGFLEGYLDRIESVTAGQVNAAIRTYLQTDNVKILVVTEASAADRLRREVIEGGPAYAKQPADYNLSSEGEGEGMIYRVPIANLETLRLDGAWAHYWLDLEPDRVRVVPVEALFESGAFITPREPEADGAFITPREPEANILSTSASRPTGDGGGGRDERNDTSGEEQGERAGRHAGGRPAAEPGGGVRTGAHHGRAAPYAGGDLPPRPGRGGCGGVRLRTRGGVGHGVRPGRPPLPHRAVWTYPGRGWRRATGPGAVETAGCLVAGRGGPHGPGLPSRLPR